MHRCSCRRRTAATRATSRSSSTAPSAPKWPCSQVTQPDASPWDATSGPTHSCRSKGPVVGRLTQLHVLVVMMAVCSAQGPRGRPGRADAGRVVPPVRHDTPGLEGGRGRSNTLDSKGPFTHLTLLSSAWMTSGVTSRSGTFRLTSRRASCLACSAPSASSSPSYWGARWSVHRTTVTIRREKVAEFFFVCDRVRRAVRTSPL